MANRLRMSASLWAALLLLVALAPVARAQGVQLSGFVGWRLGGSGRDLISLQDMDIGSAGSFGGTAAVAFSEKNSVELYLSRAESQAKLLFTDDPFDLEVSYLHLGFLHSLGDEGLVPFLGASVGGARLSRNDGESRTRFSLGPVAGVRYFVSDNFGIRADGRLLFIFDGSGTGTSRSTGDGSAEVRGTTIIQGELTAGIVLAF